MFGDATGGMVGASEPSHFKVGDQVLIRTVTHYNTGRIKKVTQNEFVLENASWIADTGEFGKALETGKVTKCDKFPDVVAVRMAAIVDIAPWPHTLPTAR
jgi:hypothetical protein